MRKYILSRFSDTYEDAHDIALRDMLAGKKADAVSYVKLSEKILFGLEKWIEQEEGEN